MKIRIRFNRFIMILMPGVAGFALFFLFPFIISFSYMFEGVGIISNVNGMLHNEPFIKAMKNTAQFLFISVPPNLLLSLGFAILLDKSGGACKHISLLLMLLPMAVPSAAAMYFWKSFFAVNGFLNRWLGFINFEPIDWIGSKYVKYVVVGIYLWKNLGFNIILFLSALYSIPEEYAQYAETEGATGFQIFVKIKLFLLMPTVFATLLMSVINSFKIFREIYMITGAYPSGDIYLVQHYMNNMFASLNYTKLSISSNLFMFIIVFASIAVNGGKKLLYERTKIYSGIRD